MRIPMLVLVLAALAACGSPKAVGSSCSSRDECETGYCECASACRTGCCKPRPAELPICTADCADLTCKPQ